MKPIVLVNHWHDDNRGDSAITHATLSLIAEAWPERPVLLYTLNGATEDLLRSTRHMRRSFAQLSVRPTPVPAAPLGARPWAIAAWVARVGWLGFRLLLGRPPARLAEVREAHAVCLLGGSNLFVHGRHRALGVVRLVQLLLPALVAQRAGVPTYFLGHTIGPLRGRAAKRLVRATLSRANLVTVREQRSAALLAELGVPDGRWRVVPDLAFALTPSTAQTDALLRRSGLQGTRFLVVSVRRHPYRRDADTDRMLAEVSKFAREAVKIGLAERVAVVAQALGPTAIEDDRDISRQLAAAIGSNAVFLDEDLSSAELAGIYGGAIAVVAVRLHAAILAMTAGTPALAIGYFTTKTEGVFELLGIPDMCCGFADVSAAFLLHRLRAGLDDSYGGQLRARTQTARDAVRELAQELK